MIEGPSVGECVAAVAAGRDAIDALASQWSGWSPTRVTMAAMRALDDPGVRRSMRLEVMRIEARAARMKAGRTRVCP